MANEIYGKTIASTYEKLLFTVSDTGIGSSATYIATNADGSASKNLSPLSLSTSKVGIGTSSPASELHVSSSDSTSTVLRLTNSTTGESSGDGVLFQLDASEGCGLWNYEATEMYFATNNNRRMTILSNGNVGIGASSPLSEFHIESADSTAYDGAAQQVNAGTELIIKNTHTGALTSFAALRLVNSGTGTLGNVRLCCVSEADDEGELAITVEDGGQYIEAMRIDKDGNVGIGTSSPDYLLQVEKNNANAEINIKATGTGIFSALSFGDEDDDNIGQLRYDHNNNRFGLNTNAGSSGDGITVNSSNYVGIGTASPENLLHIVDVEAATGKFYDTHSQLIVEDTDARLQIIGDYSSENASALVLSNVNTADDNTDSWFLHHNGVGNSGRFSIGYNANQTADEDVIGNKTLATDPFTILTGGNVGIGTESPGYLLSIGDITDDTDTILQLACDTDNAAGIIFTEESTHKWLLYLDGDDSDQFEVHDYSDTSTAVHIAAGGTTWVSGSDERIKKDIENVGSVLDGINNLRPITYKRKYGLLDNTNVGLIAQEVKPHFPLVVSGNENDFVELTPTEDRPKKYKGEMGIEYTSLIPYLIKAIQELSTKITALENA